MSNLDSESLTINFGDIYRRDDIDPAKYATTYVIIDVGKGSTFSSCAILEIGGKKLLDLASTSARRHIGSLTGERWSLDMVVLGFENYSPGLGEDIKDLLITNSQKGSRILPNT